MALAPYLPEVWNDDEEMLGLMAVPKAKHIHPKNYNRVVEFWTNLISEYCKHQKNCLFTMDELKQKFRRRNILPGPLSITIKELQACGQIETQNDYQSKNMGWIQWGTSLLQPSSWFGANEEPKNPQFIHMETLDHLSNELLRFYLDAYQLVDCPEVVDFKELKLNAQHIVEPRCFGLVIDELVRRGEVSMGHTKKGDKILKFKDQSEGRAKFTDTDASVHELRRNIARLQEDLAKCEVKADKFKLDASAALKKGDKKGALLLMKRYKLLEKEIAAKDSQYQNLFAILQKLSQSKQNREILDIYQSSSKAFKDTLTRQGLTVDNVDLTIDEVHGAIQDYNDIDEALREGFRNMPVHHEMVDDEDLMKELGELVEAEEPARPVPTQQPVPELSNQVRIGKRVLDMDDMPEVPSDPLATQESNNANDSLEVRWKRLRANLATAE